MKKKSRMYVVIASCIILILLGLYIREKINPSRAWSRIEYEGTIISYEQTDEGLVFTLDTSGFCCTNTHKFILKDDPFYQLNTVWYYPDNLEERLMQQETGIDVYIVSIYSPENFNGIYPITFIAEEEEYADNSEMIKE